MQVVIDVPEDKYNTIMNYPKKWDEWALNAIKNGTPLEEHCDSCIYMPTESEDE